MKNHFKVAVIVCLTLLLSVPLFAEEYRKYERKASAETLLELIVSAYDWEFVVYEEDEQVSTYTIPVGDIKKVEGRLICGDGIEISEEGFHIKDHFISFDDIGRARIRDESFGRTVIRFEGKKPTRSSTFQRKKKDQYAINDIIVEEDDFVLGSVISFYGDIDIYGEVNNDVVALFGEIFIGEDAVVRGDAIAVLGKVKLDKDASVYGTVSYFEHEKTSRRSRARRWKKFDNMITFSASLAYNRVDGLLLMSGFEYEHGDSILPSFKTLGGYAFASDRWRYQIELTQTIFRGPVPLQIGGSYYRLLKSRDDKLIGGAENFAFAMIVNEDWKDYYEAEGGYLFARTKIMGVHKFEIGYLSEKHNWLDAHPKLWSVFGAKDFRENFSSVPYDVKQARMDDFEDSKLTSLILDYEIDTRDDEDFPTQGWLGSIHYENSPEKWNGDFDFKQIETRLLRMQPVGRYVTLRLSGAYGYTEGDRLPLNRQFFLGGLGTMHGYRHKEYMGDEYVFASAEYSLRLPHTDISPFVLFDAGRIAEGRLSSADPWRSSIGFGIYSGEDMKIFVSKRLDRDGEDPVIYVRLSSATF